MKTTNNSEDSFLNFGKDYEAHLFDYVLRHVRKDNSLDAEIGDAISTNLFQDEYYGKYYLKVKELYGQGLFNDSFSYIDYLVEAEQKSANLPLPEEFSNSEAADSPSLGKQAWFNNIKYVKGIAASAIIILAATVVVMAYLGSSSNGSGVKLLGEESNLYGYNLNLAVADLEIKHNSVLLSEPGDMKQCNMYLVFKGITDEGFVARSKNLGEGAEDPYNEDLEVRFPDSKRSSEIIQSLQKDLNSRKFPEYIVQGIYIKPKDGLDTYNDMSVILINDLKPVYEGQNN